MRELERDSLPSPLSAAPLAVIGRGRVGASLARAHGASTFSLHPLQTFADGGTAVEGTPAAIAGSDREALAFARSLAPA